MSGEQKPRSLWRIVHCQKGSIIRADTKVQQAHNIGVLQAKGRADLIDELWEEDNHQSMDLVLIRCRLIRELHV